MADILATAAQAGLVVVAALALLVLSIRFGILIGRRLAPLVEPDDEEPRDTAR